MCKNETPKTHSRRDFTKLANLIQKNRIPHESLWSEDCKIGFGGIIGQGVPETIVKMG